MHRIIMGCRIRRLVQDKEARESRLLREYEAEKIEEFGEAARTDFTRKSTPSSKTLTLTNYLKSSYVSRRDGKLRELEEVCLKSIKSRQHRFFSMTR